MKIALSKNLFRKIERTIEGFEFEVGVLDNKPHRLPVETPLFTTPNLKTFAGGPVRATSRNKSEFTIGDVLIQNSERLGIDLLREPFKNPESEINRFTTAFLRFAAARKGSLRRVENLLQAVVRNPILRQEYGANKATTADNKGFDRHLFDTGQMFRAIKAVVKRV